MDHERVAVFYRSQRAGTLSKTPEGFVFRYDPDYLAYPAAMPVSRSLPLRLDSYKSKELFSFFAGLLPEGWLLHMTCAVTKIDKNDHFRLLIHTGEDPVGAVSMRPIKEHDDD